MIYIYTMKEGWTALIVASHYGHINVVNELAKRGAELDLKTVYSFPIIYFAKCYNNILYCLILYNNY